MKFRDTVGRYRSSPKWRSWRPSPSVLVTVVSLMVLTGSIAWASDATVRVTATDDATGQQSGIGVLYKDTGNGDYAPAMVRADPNVGADAHVRLTGTDAQGQQTGVNVAYHDTGNGDYAPIFQEVNAQGTPVTGGGGAAPTATPSCADLGGNCTFTSVAVSGSTGNTSLSVAGVQPTSVATSGAGTDAQRVVGITGAAGGNNTGSGSGGTGSDGDVAMGNGGAASQSGAQGGAGGGFTVLTGTGGQNLTAGGNGGASGEIHLKTGQGGDAASIGGNARGFTVEVGDGGGGVLGGNGGAVTIGSGRGGAATTGGTGGNGGDASVVAYPGGSSDTQGGDGGTASLQAGDAGAGGDANGGNVALVTGAGGGAGTSGSVTVDGRTIAAHGGALSINGCVMSAATPAVGAVIAATNATTCSFATPAAAGTAAPTATPQPPVAQQNYCGASVTSVITTTHYVSVNCGANSTTESAVQIAAPSSTTAQNLYITTQATEGASGNLSVTLRKNGVDTTLKVTVNANSAAGNYSDTTHTVSLAAGDLIDFSTIDSGNATSAPWVAAMTFANGVATGTCVLTSATPVPGTFLFAQASNNCVWSTPTPRATATPQATATLVATATPEIHAIVTQNTPAAGTTLFFPGPQGTPGIYVTPTGGGSASGYSFLTQNYANSQSCSPCGAGVQISAGATSYLNIGLWFPSITEAYREDVVPYNATAGYLTMHGDNGTSQPATGNLTCTLRRLAGPAFTAADTTVTTNIAAGSGTSSVTDSTHTASFAAGDMFSFKCVNGASTGSIYLKSLAIGFKPS